VAWPAVQLADVLALDIDAVPVDPTISYNMAGVYSFGRGLFSRGPLSGAETTYKYFHRLSSGTIVLSQLKAWEGAVAVVSDEHAGSFLSTQFPTFKCNTDVASVEFVGWYLRNPSVWDQLRLKARGMGARRDSVSPAGFLSLSMPLPPLEKQRAVVRRLKHVQAGLAQLNKLRGEVRHDRDALLLALMIGPPESPHPRVPFGHVATLRGPDTIVQPGHEYPFAGVYSFGRGVFRAEKKLGSEFSYKRLSKIRAGDFIYPKLMAWEGALGVVPNNCDGLYVSPEFPVFSLSNDVVHPEIVDAYFRHPTTWPNLDASSKGTNVRRRRIHPSVIVRHEVPVPPPCIQDVIRQIVQAASRENQPENCDNPESIIPAMLHLVFEEGAGDRSDLQKLASRDVPLPRKNPTGVSAPFKEAVLVGAIVSAFQSDGGQPLGNFRLQKAVYFARRHMGEAALDREYLRKAAGPYNPSMRYSGGIKIATEKKWIARARGGFGEGSTLGSSAAEMGEWIEKYQFAPAAAWVRDKFKFKSNDVWETLATVDYAKLALEHAGKPPTAEAILAFVDSDPEWHPKIAKLRLTKASIQNAVAELQNLFA